MGRKQAQAFLAALISAPIAAQDYTPAPIPPQIIGTPQTSTPLNGGDDSTRLVQLGFPFEYYGQTYTQAWVSSNGFISFNNIGHLCCDGWPIDSAPRNSIYGLWMDLISGGNPYYRTDANIALFGWYNTQEYGSNLSNTFEIALFPDGKVQWNYGDVNNVWHTVTAGLTGPTMADSISIFYGQNVNLLDNTSYVALGAPPQPEPPPPPIEVAPVVVYSATAIPVVVIEQQEEQIEAAEAAVEDAIVAMQDVVEETPTETAVDEPQAETAQEEPEEATEAEEASESAAEASPASQPPPPPGSAPQGSSEQQQSTTMVSGTRRERNVEFFQSEAVEEADLFARETVIQASTQNVAFLALADAQYEQQYGEQKSTETDGVTYSLQPTEGPTFVGVTTTTIGDTYTPVGQAQQLEVLNMGMQGEMAAGQNIDVGDVNNGDNEAMVQLAAIPAGYSAYTQARIPDQPFYQPRDIYKGRRIPDANMVLYRMMQGSDGRWQQMVDEQYE
jgi:hypothetical protein